MVPSWLIVDSNSQGDTTSSGGSWWLSLFSWFNPRGASIAPPPRAAWPLVLATAFTETAGFVAVSFARRFAPLAVVTPVSSLASALTLVYAWLVLRERPRPLAAAGAAIASTGIVVLAM